MTTKDQKQQNYIAFWRPHILAWHQSGLNMTAYTKKHDLNYHQFKYWLKRLSVNKTKKKAQATTKPKDINPDIAFTQLAVEQPKIQDIKLTGLSTGIILELGELKCHLKMGFDGASLQRLLDLFGDKTC